MKRMKKTGMLCVLLLTLLWMPACGNTTDGSSQGKNTETVTLEEIPEYSGEPYVEVKNNKPDFSEQELETKPFEEYSDLDELGRCGTAEAKIGQELMPQAERESISEVKPSGWVNKKYDNVDGGYLYNRCHLIGYQLTAENANEENLITGTRYMNTEGMLPFENMVADYIQDTGNHVMYRVTPVYEEDNLLASGVQMEAESVEDKGKEISFNVYVYNVQPGIEIDYETGESEKANGKETENGLLQSGKTTYIVNTNTKKFHKPDCSGVKDMKASNKMKFTGTKEEAMEKGYSPCGTCRP